MLSIYTRRDGSNRRSILMINGVVVKVEPDQYDVRVEARDRDSELTYVLHLSHEAVAGLYGHSQRVQRPLLAVSAFGPAPETAATPETSLEVERQVEPDDASPPLSYCGTLAFDSRAELAREVDDQPCPDQTWAKFETAERKARDWAVASGRAYTIKFFPSAREGRGGYAPVTLETLRTPPPPG